MIFFFLDKFYSQEKYFPKRFVKNIGTLVFEITALKFFGNQTFHAQLLGGFSFQLMSWCISVQSDPKNGGTVSFSFFNNCRM